MTDSERNASEAGFMTAFEQKADKNPFKEGSREAGAWAQGHAVASRIVAPGHQLDSLDQVAKYRTPGFDGNATMAHAKQIVNGMKQEAPRRGLCR
jgi:hypothetical protein